VFHSPGRTLILVVIRISHTDKGQPRDVVKSIKPAWNNFVFFEVNLVSFHQVMSCVLLTVDVIVFITTGVRDPLCG